MTIKDTLKLKSLPGLAEWAEWGEAIARVMGYPEMEFINAYKFNISKQNEYVVDTNPFASAVSLLYEDLFSFIDSDLRRRFKYNEDTRIYTTSGNDFLIESKKVAIREGIDTSDYRFFPQAVNKISYQLNIIKSNLKSLGIGLIIRYSRTKEDLKNGFGKNTMIIDLKSSKMLDLDLLTFNPKL